MSRLGKGPQLREHHDFVLTGNVQFVDLIKDLDENRHLYTEIVKTAELEQGIDWKEMRDERHTIEASALELENISVVSEDASVESTNTKMTFLRNECKLMNLTHHLYDSDFGKLKSFFNSLYFSFGRREEEDQCVIGIE